MLRQLWDAEIVNWHGQFRTPLDAFTAMPRPLDGKPPFVWHGSIRSPEIAEQAAKYGDGFFVNNLFMSIDYFARYVDYYRERYAAHGHGTAEDAIVGVGAALYLRRNSQDAMREFAPYYYGHPVMSSSGTLEDAIARTGLIVGSPAQAVDRVMSFREQFGDYRRQLFAVEQGGVPEASILETLDLLGQDVVPALNSELHSASSQSAVGAPARPQLAVAHGHDA